MFAIQVETRFSAAHALLIRGVREPLHGHDWLVQARIVAKTLDQDGLLYDFHAICAEMDSITSAFRNANLNEIQPFTFTNPSAEAVAKHIGDQLSARLETRLAREPKQDQSRGIRVESVLVTEAPGCAAIYFPPPADS